MSHATVEFDGCAQDKYICTLWCHNCSTNFIIEFIVRIRLLVRINNQRIDSLRPAFSFARHCLPHLFLCLLLVYLLFFFSFVSLIMLNSVGTFGITHWIAPFSYVFMLISLFCWMHGNVCVCAKTQPSRNQFVCLLCVSICAVIH